MIKGNFAGYEINEVFVAVSSPLTENVDSVLRCEEACKLFERVSFIRHFVYPPFKDACFGFNITSHTARAVWRLKPIYTRNRT